MRKRLALLFLMKFSGLWLLNAEAQSQLSFEQYSTMGSGSPLTIMPVAGFQTNNGFYAEGRYNYEELNTFSFYMGRTFSKESNFSYSVSPMAGAVMGQYNGGSLGANISLGYKNFYIYSQPQYTFSLAGAVNNFIYSWTDFTYSPLDWLSVGLSVQHTKPYQEKGVLENGLVIEAAYKKFTFPIYIFNPQSNARTVVFGANFELNFKKQKKEEPKKSDTFHESYPVNFLATKPQGEPKLTASPVLEPSKPAIEGVVKVRRVNVVTVSKKEVSSSEEYITNAQATSKQPAKDLTSAQPKAMVIPEKGKSTPPNYTTSKPSNLVTKQEDKKLAPAGTKNNQKAVVIPVAREAPHVLFFALLLGPFNNEKEAIDIQAKLTEVFNRQVVVFSEASKYKLRIPGFRDQKEAEAYNLNALNEGCKATAIIVPYKLKSVDPVSLKNISKPFEATHLY